MKTKSKIIAFIAALACCFSTVGLSSISALADKVENTVENKTYCGETVTPDTINAFTKRDVTLKNLNLEDPFVELLILPSEKGTSEVYTPDFEKLTLKVFSPTDQNASLTISVFQHYLITGATEMSEKHIAINVAGGANQSLAAEWRGSRTENKDRLGTGWGGNIPQSFDGYTHASSYVDQDGNLIARGSDSRAIRLYYDATENALYTDVGREDEHTRITMDNGKYRWRIRDFDYQGYQDNPTNNWSGFNDGDKLKFSVEFDKVKEDKTPTILISKLMGETVLSNQIIVSTPSDGEVGIPYPIPEPVFYNADEYKEETFTFKNGSYKVEIYDKNASGGKRLVKGYQTFRADSSFTPSEVGKYCITYRASNYEKVKEIDINVKAANTLEGVTLQPNIFAESCYVYQQFDIGVSCSHPSQSFKPTVSLKIKRNGNVFVNAFAVDEHFDYRFDQSGEYELIYTCVDYLGRATTVTHYIDVQRYSVNWKEPTKENVAIPLGCNVQVPSVADVEVFDLVFNQVAEIETCDITVSFNGGTYQPLKAQGFNSVGEYTVKYAITYQANGLERFEVERKIFIYNEFFNAITVNGLPTGTKLASETENSVEIELKALKDKEIVIPYNYFNQVLNSVTVTAPDGSVQEIMDKILIGDYTFTPNCVGVYEVFALIEDGTYRAVKVLYIDVREKWVEFSNVNDLRLPIGSDMKAHQPICVDYYGNSVEFITEVYFMGEKLEGTLLNNYGTYEIVYLYNQNGENVRTSCEVTTFDNGNPTIKINKGKTTAYKNQMVEIAGYTALDDSGLPPQVLISVTHNGESVSIVNNTFKVTEKGDYVVTYTVIDIHGNTIVAKYTVTAKGFIGGCNGSIAFTSSATLALLGAIVLIIKKRNKIKGEN